MIQLKRILFPTDFSKNAKFAQEYACAFVEHFGAELHLLHETITRNHRCRTIEELLDEVYQWANAHRTFFCQTVSFRTNYKLSA